MKVPVSVKENDNGKMKVKVLKPYSYYNGFHVGHARFLVPCNGFFSAFNYYNSSSGINSDSEIDQTVNINGRSVRGMTFARKGESINFDCYARNYKCSVPSEIEFYY